LITFQAVFAIKLGLFLAANEMRVNMKRSSNETRAYTPGLGRPFNWCRFRL